MKLQLVQIIQVKKSNPYYNGLDKLCYLSKNLYNSALYQIRQHYKETEKYLSYYDLAKKMVSEHNVDYYALPYAQSAQQILRQIDSTYNAFFRSLHAIKNQGKRIHTPKYKDKEAGRNIFVYTNQCAKVKNNILKLKGIDEYFYFNTDKKDIQQVRIVPKGNHINIEIVYNVEYQLQEDNNRYASIDIGLNNICTLTSNVVQSIIYNGRPLKQINQYYNKRKAELQSKLKDRKTSNRIKRLSERRNNKIKDSLHKISTSIINYMKSNQLTVLFVGKNNGWKDSINMGKLNNQSFVSIPYNILIQMLEYKSKLAGIKLIILNEAYTSKCSFLDKEKICKHDSYAGERTKRGLFISKSGIRINADINGALNILRKGIDKLKVTLDVYNICRPENMRFVLNPIRVTIL